MERSIIVISVLIFASCWNSVFGVVIPRWGVNGGGMSVFKQSDCSLTNTNLYGYSVSPLLQLNFSEAPSCFVIVGPEYSFGMQRQDNIHLFSDFISLDRHDAYLEWAYSHDLSLTSLVGYRFSFKNGQSLSVLFGPSMSCQFAESSSRKTQSRPVDGSTLGGYEFTTVVDWDFYERKLYAMFCAGVEWEFSNHLFLQSMVSVGLFNRGRPMPETNSRVNSYQEKIGLKIGYYFPLLKKSQNNF